MVKNQKKPTEAELNILNVIWAKENATVREVHDHLKSKQKIGYTTVLKLMQIMTEKGILTRDSSVRPQIFKSAIPRQQTQKALLARLLDQVFDGAPGPMILQALSMNKSTPEELSEIRKLIDDMKE